ncbi:MAG: ATP-binding protein [Leptospiraceae bacterium]|nr:ATP-binding protein [Leptospiraceae bacterium]
MANIINIQNYTDALRNTGYKNTESAIAEIIDNSLEANAKNVIVLCKLEIESNLNRKFISEIAILDDGIGMNLDTLSKCLSIGESTRRSRKGMGRFGVGLPQASLHVCPRVEVYSWQKAKAPNFVFMDIDQISSGKQKEIFAVEGENLPKEYQNIEKKISYNMGDMNFSNSGTLVIWRNCDRLNPKTPTALFDRFEFSLGRKFRYYIQDGCNIGLSVLNDSYYDRLIPPNDPLYLMENNQILGNPKTFMISKGDGIAEPIFEPWESDEILGSVEVPIKYIYRKNLKESIVTIRFSIAKFGYQNLGGEYEVGKHCKKNVGISVVRANREIDFGKFDFYDDVNEPQHRWWGCEIKFDPVLDERFGVANNKQQVELFKIEQEANLDESDELEPVWITLNEIIHKEIRKIYNTLRSKKKGSRTEKRIKISTEEATVNKIEEKNPVDTDSKTSRKKMSDDDWMDYIGDKLKESGNPTPSKEEILPKKKNAINILFKDMGDTSQFIEITTDKGNCWLTINTGSVFYRELYSQIQEKDEELKRAFNLFLMAYARAEDESVNDKLKDSFHKVRELWGKKVEEYLKSDYKA